MICTLCIYALVQLWVFFHSQDNRESILLQLAQKEEELAQLNSELQKYRECDPEVMQEMKEETVVAKDAANRWTGIVLTLFFT